MVNLSRRDIAIAIWEFHRERTGNDCEDFKNLHPWEQEVLLSAAAFVRPYILHKDWKSMVEFLKQTFDPVDYGCEGCHYLTKIQSYAKGVKKNV